MNDFTKEELEEILSFIETYYEDIEDFLEKNPVINKIQSMIENYCDHEWENPCCGCSNSTPYCTKCERNLYEKEI